MCPLLEFGLDRHLSILGLGDLLEVARKLGLEHLERDITPDTQLMSEVDSAEASLPQKAFDFVPVLKGGPQQRILVQMLLGRNGLVAVVRTDASFGLFATVWADPHRRTFCHTTRSPENAT